MSFRTLKEKESARKPVLPQVSSQISPRFVRRKPVLTLRQMTAPTAPRRRAQDEQIPQNLHSKQTFTKLNF